MNKRFDLEIIIKAIDILEKVKETIDPHAFIAGGLPASLYLGQNWRSDIDIFFSSPNFEVDPLGKSAFRQLKALFEDLESVDQQTYWYNKRFCRVGKMGNVDFVQIKNAPKQDVQGYVFEKFDINMCKIAMNGNHCEYHHNLSLEPSKEFLLGLETKTLIYDTKLSDYKYESEAQAKITLTRLEKYKQRFPDFNVVKAKARSKKSL